MEDLELFKKETLEKMHLRSSSSSPRIVVGMGTCGIAAGARATMLDVVQELRNQKRRDVKVTETGCIGICAEEPLMEVHMPGQPAVIYGNVDSARGKQIVQSHIMNNKPIDEWILNTNSSNPFFRKQIRIVLEDCGIVNPESIEEYVAQDGYLGLARALQMKPEEVVEAVKQSGLRGRGGAGFPTGLKWSFAAKANSDQKYVVCNADEGDPGAFMDRSTIEGDPHKLLEGMAIAGYAIGASQGYVYARAEYPLAVERLEKAIKDAHKVGLLGENILGSGFDFDIDLRLGAGAFVCGEETALLNSIMGKRGEPRPRPPFPAAEGLWGKPTVINNVETLANVPVILRKGVEWFSKIGTEKSKGTKVFALAGKIKNNGLVEVPMGTTIGEIVFDIGGGLTNGKKFKAVQTGGPSGGCIPSQFLNTPVDYESLAELGTMMGSGGFVVMDEDTCMVDLAKFFLEFVQSESCGKCAPCRIGTKRMLEILERITEGKGKEGDIELLEELGHSIKESALCGLGQSAPNPVLSTIRYFRHEYEAHIKDKTCPASVCTALVSAPCKNFCPGHVDVPTFVDLIGQGRFDEAYEDILRENPLPFVCSRVCYHPCEIGCDRSRLEKSIDIKKLKRTALDHILQHGGSLKQDAKAPTGKKVAIVGSGPAGLSASRYLALQGHAVTIFEAQPVPGGMLSVGIPGYRLPGELVNKDIEAIKALGVDIKVGVRVGTDISWETLRNDYDATFMAIGTHKDQPIGIKGEDLPGVMPGLDFLYDLNLGKDIDFKGKKVVVAGSGNVAVDAARSATWLGAEKVTVICKLRSEDATARKEEIEAALEEDIVLKPMVCPVEITSGGNGLRVKCVRMEPGEYDPRGGRKTYPVEGTEFYLDCDVFIRAAGQAPDATGLVSDGLEIDEFGTLEADSKTMATGIPGVFAGGDCVSGPSTVIDAIEAGKKAASAINQYLGGSADIVPKSKHDRKTGAAAGDDKKAEPFAEVDLGHDIRQARLEAQRCLRCDVKK